MRFPLQGAVSIETSYISFDDRFAAQIVYAADPSSVAPQSEGGCPPMHRLVTDFRSFHLQFHGLRLVTKSLPYLQGAALAQAAVLRRQLSLFHIRPECRFAVYPK